VYALLAVCPTVLFACALALAAVVHRGRLAKAAASAAAGEVAIDRAR
jgi:hypothetical protein